MATIEKRGDTYRIRVSAGYDINGDQIRPSMTWRPEPGMTQRQIEKELERQKVLFDERVQSGQYISGDIRLADFIEKWLNEYGKAHLKATTYKNYRDCMKRILPALGHIPLCRLQPHHLISFYENLEEEGIRADTKYRPCKDIRAILRERHIQQNQLAQTAALSIGTIKAVVKGGNVKRESAMAIAAALNMPLSALFEPVPAPGTLSGATALYYHRVLSSVLMTAVQWQVIIGNPCTRVKPPRAAHKEAKYLDDRQSLELLKCLEGEPLVYRTLFTVLLFSGMRRGEACGLAWEDIDFKHCLIDINKASLYLSDRGIFDDDTKTASSRRVIKLPDQAMELLTAYKVEQAKERLKLGEKWTESGKVFTSWNGKPIHPDTVSGWFHDFIKRHDLPECTVHSLRHTNATLLIASGTDIKTVSKRLGHANVTTTGNIYTHAIKTADEMAADTLQDLFTPSKGKRA